MHPILFTLGPLTIYTYGVFVFLGVVSGYAVCLSAAKKAGVDTRLMSDIVFWTVVFSFLGARVFYILVEIKAFLADPAAIVLARSGFVFYGGVIFGAAALYVLSKKYRLHFWQVADCFGLAMPLAHAFGRVGCFFYGCCYGRVTASFVGIAFPEGSPAYCGGLRVIPTQLIEAGLLLLLFLVLLFVRKHSRVPGQVFLLYILLYAFIRYGVELYRADPRGGFLFFSTSQIISFAMVAFVLVAARFLDYRRK